MTEDDISHCNGLDYARTTERGARARRARRRPTPRSSCAPRRSSRSATSRRPGENMPPKSTYFFPKVLTGMVFNPAERVWHLVDRSARHGRIRSAMRAVARSASSFTHDVKVRDHQLTADEPRGHGGERHGPEPAGAAGRRRSPRARRSRWRCTPSARAGTSAGLEVDCRVHARPSAAARPGSSSSCGCRRT